MISCNALLCNCFVLSKSGADLSCFVIFFSSIISKMKGGFVRNPVSIFTVIVSCIFLLVITDCGEKAASDVELAKATRHMANSFMEELKTELYAAIEDSGVVAAIAVCAERAPEISNRYSSLPGWTVKRVSAKYRNPNNAPDEFEKESLEILENRPATAGDEYFSWVDENGKKSFRFMKVIKMKARCLKCHGDKGKFDDDLLTILEEKYPDDQATGFKLDEQRGAFSVTVKWPEGKAVFDSVMTSL